MPDSLADALRKWLDDEDIGQDKGAEMIGISPETMHRLLQGEGNPRRSTLKKIISTCDIDASELI